jgi:hypothetical protein
VRRMGALEGKDGEGNALGFAGLARAVAASWKALDEDSKKPFYDMADHEQIRYKAQCDDWRKSRRRFLNSEAKCDYVLQPRSPTPDDSQQRRTAPTAHASRRSIPQPTNCYSPETTHGDHVPGIISVATEVTELTNDGNDSLDLSPRHYGNYTPNGYDNVYDTCNTNTNTTPHNYSTYANTYTTQSQRNGHPGHYGNFRSESTGPIHSREQHGGFYSGPAHSPGTYDAARSGDSDPVYSSYYNRNTYSSIDYGPAQYMWCTVPRAVAGRRNPNNPNPDHDHDAALWKRPSSLSVPLLATVSSSVPLGSPYSIDDTKESSALKAESFEHMMDELEKEHSSLTVPSLATVGSCASLGSPYSIGDTKESSGHNKSFEYMMDELEKEHSSLRVPLLATVPSSASLDSPYSIDDIKESSDLEMEDDSCDVWAWLKGIKSEQT